MTLIAGTTYCRRTLAGSLLDRVGPRVITVLGVVAVAVATIPFAFAAGAHTGE
jgi:nitrate/nitrite transporter NarK